jgi:hypothetical protein
MTELLTHFQEDVLADILQSLRMHSTLYCRAKMGAPWGFRVSQRARPAGVAHRGRPGDLTAWPYPYHD